MYKTYSITFCYLWNALWNASLEFIFIVDCIFEPNKRLQDSVSGSIWEQGNRLGFNYFPTTYFMLVSSRIILRYHYDNYTELNNRKTSLIYVLYIIPTIELGTLLIYIGKQLRILLIFCFFKRIFTYCRIRAIYISL